MNWARLILQEFKLLTRSRLAWTALALTIGASALGLNAVENGNQLSFHGMRRTSYTLALGAAEYGATAGAALFAFLTLLRISRDDRKQCRALLEACRDYRSVLVARISALVLAATVTAALAFLAAVVLNVIRSDAPLEWLPHGFSFSVILWPALVFSILGSSALYLLVRNLDVAVLGFLGLYWMGINTPGYLWKWIQAPAGVYSDFAGIDPVGRFMVYNRLFCAAVALALLFLGFVLHRRRGFGIRHSVLLNCRNGVLPIGLALATACAVLLYHHEPYTFTGDTTWGSEQAWDDRIRLEEIACEATLHPKQRALECAALYRFEKQKNARDLLLAVNPGLQIGSLTINGKSADWERLPDGNRIRVFLPPTGSIELSCQYQGRLRSRHAGGFAGYIAPKSVYLLENSHWLFVPQTATRDRVSVRGTVTAPEELTVVTPGVTTSVEEHGAVRVWAFSAEAPRLHLGLFAAEYDVDRFQVNGMDVEFYFSPRHERYVRGAQLSEHLAQIVRFYQELYGPPAFPEWPLKIVENSIYKPGGHSSLNVVTIAEYMLNRQDPHSELDQLRLQKHDLKLFAHEIAHQWWGTGVGVVEEGPWSSEGLAEFSAFSYSRRHLTEGVDSSIRGGWYAAVKARRDGFWTQSPEAVERLRPTKRRQMELSKMMTDLYSRMPLHLVEAEDRMGEAEFASRLSSVYTRHRGGSLTLGQFLDDMSLTREELIHD